MRNTPPGPRNGFWLIALIGLVLLFTYFLSACSSGPTPAPFESPVETSTPPPYPPPGDTPPSKPTATPAPTPTNTPIPTPLSLPPAAYYALWFDTVQQDIPGGPKGTIWLADPNNIAGRYQVVHFDDREIRQAAVSPDGRQLGFTAVVRRAQQTPLWVINVNGQGLTQLRPDADQIAWSRDGLIVAYTVGVVEEGVAIETVVVATGQTRRLVTGIPNTPLYLLGWSANDQQVYYMRSSPQTQGYSYELWAVGRNGQNAHSLTSLGNELLYPPVLSPNGSKYLITTHEGFDWISADGQVRQSISLPPWKEQCGVIWSPTPDELVFCHIYEPQPIEHIKTFNIITDVSSELATLGSSPGGKARGPVALSPDKQWMVAAVYLDGIYWVHLPSGTLVPVPKEGRFAFIAWVPRPVG